MYSYLNSDVASTNSTVQKREGETNKNIEFFRPLPAGDMRSPIPNKLASYIDTYRRFVPFLQLPYNLFVIDIGL